MSTTRARAGNDASGSNLTSDDRVPSGRAPATVLRGPVTEHPPFIAHVNGCDECLEWIVSYMANVIVHNTSRKRVRRGR